MRLKQSLTYSLIAQWQNIFGVWLFMSWVLDVDPLPSDNSGFGYKMWWKKRKIFIWLVYLLFAGRFGSPEINFLLKGSWPDLLLRSYAQQVHSFLTGQVFRRRVTRNAWKPVLKSSRRRLCISINSVKTTVAWCYLAEDVRRRSCFTTTSVAVPESKL